MSAPPVLKAKPPSQDRGQRRVQLLLNAAADLILLHGAEGLKMDMVAKQAKTSPGSLYQFLPNRAALLAALASRYGTELSALAEENVRRQIAEPPPNLATAARDFLQPFLDFYVRNQAYVILAEATERIFGAQGHTFSEDDVVQEALIQALTPYVTPAQKGRLLLVSQMLIINAHAAIAASFEMAADARAAWVDELDRFIQSYVATLQES